MLTFASGLLLLIASIFCFFLKGVVSSENTKLETIKRIVCGVCAIVAILFLFSSFIVTLAPGHIGIAYQLSGASSNLKVGYNLVPPWAKIHIWDITTQVVTFSEGEAKDDIYGAQTTEKDYITVVATIGVHVDTSKIQEYISLYGNEQVNSNRILKLLKTVSRDAIEKTIGSYKTAEVMENKKKIAEEAGEYFKKAVASMPIVIDSFTIDDLVAPESYENAIREQAQLRMDREKATLQQQVNEQQAAANKVKAEGEAQVLKTQAEAQAEVKRIEAENSALVKKIEAENAAEVAKIKADNDAEVKKIQAEADASVKVTEATASAEATVKQGEAEAAAIKAQGTAYKENPQLIELRVKELQTSVEKAWAEKWSGYSFNGTNGISFTNFTDIIKSILPQVK